MFNKEHKNINKRTIALLRILRISNENKFNYRT